MKMIDIPPVWLAVFAAIAWSQARVLPGPVPSPWISGIGAVLVAVGLGLIAAAVWAFAKGRTSVIPHMTPKAILTTGIFAFSRNPIYLGDALILFGLCLRWGAWPSLILVPLFLILIERRFILAEEARLEAGFPEAFAAYRARVRRWL